MRYICPIQIDQSVQLWNKFDQRSLISVHTAPYKYYKKYESKGLIKIMNLKVFLTSVNILKWCWIESSKFERHRFLVSEKFGFSS